MSADEGRIIEHQERVALALRLALAVLSQRLLTLAALFLMAGMFGWAMYAGGWDRLAISAAFGVGAWCLVKLKPRESAE